MLSLIGFGATVLGAWLTASSYSNGRATRGLMRDLAEAGIPRSARDSAALCPAGLILWGLHEEGSLSLAGVFRIMFRTVRHLPDRFLRDGVPQRLE